MRRAQVVALAAVLLAVAGLGEGIALYTDWLWFEEVGYTGVFLTILLVQAGLVAVAAAGVFAALFLNARLATRRAAPDVLLSGDHAAVAAWRARMMLARTRERRPDLLA